jgi:hypothetical protein
MTDHDPEPWTYADGDRVDFCTGHNLQWGPFVGPHFRPREGFEQDFKAYEYEHSLLHHNRWLRNE